MVADVGLGDGTNRDSMIHLYAFDERGHEQLLDRGASSKLPIESLKLSGEDVTWLHGGSRGRRGSGPFRSQ